MTRGAERLDVIQPAVSKQVQELERVLGVHLVRRKGRRDGPALRAFCGVLREATEG
jgi:DNA-binding transcriptional LysR family regulator